ncbi:MAG: PorV/PorQ family protein [Candidatus Stahlbacteria bacterium]|nr:PorV/PorQ family protein [Candidatus Stahlbacteria bacterium]
MIYFLLLMISSFSEAGEFFLIISPGARQVAMGSAFTGVADDFTAVYYNPAGLAFCKNVNAGFMYSPWLPELWPGMKYIYTGGIVPLPIGRISLGIGCSYFNAGETVATDENGNEIGRWESYDYAIILSYGEEITKNLGIGVSLKYIYSFLVPDWAYWQFLHEHGGDAETFAFDWGMLYKTSIPGLSVGVSSQNLGSAGLCYIENGTYYPIPSLIRAGVGFNAMPLFKKRLPHFITDLKFSADLVRDLVDEQHENWYSGGSEITFKDKFSLRVGYLKKGAQKGRTYGCGVIFGPLQIDIASDADIYKSSTSNHWKIQVNFNSAHSCK